MFTNQIVEDIKLGKYKNDLSKLTFVENQLLLIENSFLKNCYENADVHLNGELKLLLDQTNVDIKKAMHRINRCVGPGDFHTVLKECDKQEILILDGLSHSCRVSLEK
jgi:hypothetical protein